MDLIINSYSTPAENLAFEEYFFNEFENDTLRLWINPSSVIVGKHQCTLAEVNYPFCEAEHIPIIRRISGGGTVFHDSGNINFSFFKNLDQDHKIDYRSNLEIIANALKGLGYDVQINERFDIYHGEFKISGNAQHIKRRKALHHGTILYDANKTQLRTAIAKPEATFKNKAVQSVRSSTKNLREIQDLGPTDEFLQLFVQKVQEDDFLLKESITVESQLASLIIDRYGNADWNYGYGPKYSFENSGSVWSIKLEVERGGNVASASISLNGTAKSNLESEFLGLKHQPAILTSYISSLKDYSVFEKEELIKILF